MNKSVPVRSISARVCQWLAEGCVAGAVLAVFDRVCNITIEMSGNGEREIIALVMPEIGDGPLNIVLDRAIDMAAVSRHAAVAVSKHSITIDDWAFSIDDAVQWNPAPAWRRLSVSADCLDTLPALARQYAPPGTLLDIVAQDEGDGLISGAVLAAMASLRAGWRKSDSRWPDGAAQLAGLGGGLTPAGDDFLAGVMLAVWLLHDAPQKECQKLLSAAAPRTTVLSAALLRRAAAGECGSAWHGLLSALSAAGDGADITGALQAVLAHGHTSGGDALAGFLWMCNVIQQPRLN